MTFEEAVGSFQVVLENGGKPESFFISWGVVRG